MLRRMVSRSVVVLAATAFLASCEDNTTGTPLTPPPASTAVYVTAVEPQGGYSVEQVTITIPAIGPVLARDTVVTVVTPDPVFEVRYPEGDAAVDQVISFSLNLPGLLAQSTATVPASGLVTPGRWIVGNPCPSETGGFCRSVQRVIAAPAAGNTGYIDVDTTLPD